MVTHTTTNSSATTHYYASSAHMIMVVFFSTVCSQCGNSALFYTVMSGNNEMLRLLIESGAKLDLANQVWMVAGGMLITALSATTRCCVVVMILLRAPVGCMAHHHRTHHPLLLRFCSPRVCAAHVPRGGDLLFTPTILSVATLRSWRQLELATGRWCGCWQRVGQRWTCRRTRCEWVNGSSHQYNTG